MTSQAVQVPSTLDLDEEQIARRAAAMSRYLQAADVHRTDQEHAARQRRHDQQADFDKRGLPRGLPPIQ